MTRTVSVINKYASFEDKPVDKQPPVNKQPANKPATPKKVKSKTKCKPGHHISPSLDSKTSYRRPRHIRSLPR